MQGEEINREVFLIPPAEANTDKLWRLNKTVYGLSDASRTWYIHVREELTQIALIMKQFSFDEMAITCKVSCVVMWMTSSGEVP